MKILIKKIIFKKKTLFPYFVFTGIFSLLFIIPINFAKAEILIPDGAGFHNDWQNMGGTGAGTFDEVNQFPESDEDTTYNKTAVELSNHSYSLTDTAKTQGAIRNIKIWGRAKGIGAPSSIKLFLRINNADYFSDPLAVNTDYNNYYYQWDTNPLNSSDWSVSDLNSLEAGFQLVGGGSEHRITQIYIQVEYAGEINTAKYHITQKLLPISNGSIINDEFTFFIADDLDEVKSAYFEIKGVVLPINPLTIDISVDPNNSNPTSSPRLKTYTINASGRIIPFKLVYDATNYFKTFVNDSGEYARWFNLKTTGESIYILNAKLIITYSWIKPPTILGAYKTSGYLISSTFDTQVIDGAGFNSIMWNGSLNNGKVRLQLAASNCSNGATNPPNCDDGIVWGMGASNYIGGNSCSNTDYYEPFSNSPAQLKCHSALNNKRYFRYKAVLCSNNCVSAGANTPQINDVIVNYSP